MQAAENEERQNNELSPRTDRAQLSAAQQTRLEPKLQTSSYTKKAATER